METRMIVIMLILKRSALNKYLLIEVPLSEKIAFGREGGSYKVGTGRANDFSGMR